MLQIRPWLVLVGAAFLATGCAAKPIPTKGVITFNGKALASANVIFTSQEPDGKSATGYTDANGAFELTTFTHKDGALPGLYKITVHPSEAVELPPGLKGPGAIQDASANAPRKASVVLPDAYARQDQTPLQHRVPTDGDAKLELKSTSP